MDTDEAASFVRFAESRHGDGWSGRAPESAEQVQAAVALRGLIAETQNARIPPELAECAAAVEAAARLAGKAAHEKLHAIEPINLQQHPELIDLRNGEREAVEQDAAEAAEQAEAEPAPAEAAS